MRLVDEDGDYEEVGWDDEGDFYLRMIIEDYEAKLAAKDQRILELEGDVNFYKIELMRSPW